MEIYFAGQRVGIDDINKPAATNKVLCSEAMAHDILLEELLKRYSLLCKVGKGKNNVLHSEWVNIF